MARETLEIFAPLANRLGIWQIKWELEDLGFRYLYPDKYREIAKLVGERRADREAYLKRVADKLRAELVKAGIEAQISERSKHIYSIYRKMQRKGVTFDQIYDAYAVRLIVKDVPTCYHALGLVHSLWRPIPGQFDDYIADPKENSYKSLHTAVWGDENKTLEVQIRTNEMHEHAEYGIAAHWRYKEGIIRDSEFERRIEALRRMMEQINDAEVAPNAEEYIAAARTDMLDEEAMIHVFTPKNETLVLPDGSTPIDFAYSVHTEIGHRCRGARINGQLVSLDYKLKAGDRVEIITANQGGPNLDWLDEPYTRTSRARGKIRAWFRKQGRPQNILFGREAADRDLKRLNSDLTHEAIARLFGMQTDDFLASVGYGDINSVQIGTRVLEWEKRKRLEREKNENAAPAIDSPQPAAIDASSGIASTGSDGAMLIKLARCCNPVQGDRIIGFVTRGKGVTVHRADCPNVINTTERERLINVNWGQMASRTYPIPIEVYCFDRPGLLHDITGVAANEGINLTDVRIKVTDNTALCLMTLQLESLDQLPRLLAQIEKLPNVMEARRRLIGAAKRRQTAALEAKASTTPAAESKPGRRAASSTSIRAKRPPKTEGNNAVRSRAARPRRTK